LTAGDFKPYPGAKIDETNKRGETPVYVAAKKGNLGALELLIKLGADIDKAMGWRSDYIAANEGKIAALKVLLDCGILKRRKDGNKMLYSVTSRRIYDLIDSISESRANVLILGETGTGKGQCRAPPGGNE
jgi:ankyrin repeat protein